MRTTDIISESDFRRQIKDDPKNGYLFFGDEDYLKAHSLRSLKDKICPDPGLEPFNYIKLDALGLTPDILLSAISTLPMMSDRKLIEVTGVSFYEKNYMTVDEYCKVLELLPEYDYNTVVICVLSKGIDEGKKTLKIPSSVSLKKLGEYLTPVHFSSPSEGMLCRWAEKHFTANGVSADAAVTARLVHYCGKDMYRLSTEIDKTSWYVLSNGRDRATPEDIEAVTNPDTGYAEFALANAIAKGDRERALQILSEMKNLRVPPEVILGEAAAPLREMLTVRLLADSGLSLSEIAKKTKFFDKKIRQYMEYPATAERIHKILQLFSEADLELKGPSKTKYEPIERMICSI